MAGVLAHKTIWLTRPAHQASAWAETIEAAGATCLREPLLDIDAPADTAAARTGLARAATADITIATSANAVAEAWRLCPDFAPAGDLYGVGAASAAALEKASGRPVAQPEAAFTSEDLLALDVLSAVAGRRVALLTGEGGRTMLADTLAARGAQVDKIAIYRRRPCAIAQARLAELIGASDAIVITSGEALSHLLRLVDGADRAALRPALAKCLLVAPSARVVKESGSRVDFRRAPVIMNRVSGEAVVAALARVGRDGE